MGFIASNKDDADEEELDELYQQYHIDVASLTEERQQVFDKSLYKKIKLVKYLKSSVTEEEFIRTFALVMLECEEHQTEIEFMTSLIGDHEMTLLMFSGEEKDLAIDVRNAWISQRAENGNRTAKALRHGMKLQSTGQAVKGARAKLANDPKQNEKAFVRECWIKWQKNADSYSSQAACARDMLNKCESLISQPKIEAWCREWKKSALTQLAG